MRPDTPTGGPTGPAARLGQGLVLFLLALSSPALAAPPTLADCDGPLSRVLEPERVSAPPATATWLDGQRLLWPGQPSHGRYRLRAVNPTTDSPDVALEAVTDERARIEAGFAHFGPGVVLAVPDSISLQRLQRWQRETLQVVAVDTGGRETARAGLQVGPALDRLFASSVLDASAGGPLGIFPREGGTGVLLWAPTASNVSFCLYPDANAPAERISRLDFDANMGGVWRGVAPENLAGRYYTYLVDVAVPGVGRVRNRVTDPYSASLSADSKRSYIADFSDPALAPPGWADDRAPALAAQTDLVVYELHVRDFSIGDASVPERDRGKFNAFAHAGSAGMRHLRSLAQAGVTDVHLLPAFDFATVPERGCTTPAIPSEGAGDRKEPQAIPRAHAAGDCFNWGYDPLHFDAPEGSYASDADDGAARIREFRAMVQALHRAGLRVGMDVVYNHMSASGQDPRSVLDRIVPGYYHRLDAKGAVETSTCCANTATERLMMARLMLDSTEAWVRRYHVDSFRFDLMGHQPRAVMEILRDRVDAAAGKPVPLLGEGWNFGEVADGARFVQASQRSLNGSRIATFSDRARDAVRGGGPADRGDALLSAHGFISATAANTDAATRRRNADWLRAGLAGSLRDYVLDGRRLEAIDYKGQPAGYVSAPDEVVNYVENHDNQTLFDLLALKLPVDLPARERARAQLLALATVAFSQGIAYFHAGGELLRSKSLDRNSYDSGDWFNRLDFTATDNGFGAGLPPEGDNGADWPLLAPRLADARIRPAPADIAFARDAFNDLLRIRASSTLFRLRTREDVRTRLTLPDPGAHPEVIAGHLDGAGYAGANFKEILYVLNAGEDAHTIALPQYAGRAWRLHPRQRDPDAADPRPRSEARIDAARGAFTVPARSAVVFVVE